MYRLIMILLLAMLITGCASVAPQQQKMPAPAAELPQGAGWWAVRFRMRWPEGRQPQWHIGALLGGEVVAPVFFNNSPDIMIWRIHRRAGLDSYGHVFSFIFYATPQSAERVYAEVEDSRVLSQLRAAGEVTWVGFDDLSRISKPGVADTSDKNWDPAVQETWPALAMGASRMWLELVMLKAADHDDEPDLLERYRLVQQDINSLWATEGQHAMLHHLSAIFAYQPLLIKY